MNEAIAMKSPSHSAFFSFNYKGFRGSVNQDKDRFFGEIESTEGPVTYEADTAYGLMTAFQKSVDSYIGGGSSS